MTFNLRITIALGAALVLAETAFAVCDQTRLMSKDQGAQEANNQFIAKGNFFQGRTIDEVNSDLGILPRVRKLAPGKVVIDLGCGRSLAIGTIFSPGSMPLQERPRSGTPESWKIRAEGMSHARFLGITATPAEQQLLPLHDPQNRFSILAGRLFQDIPSQEIIGEFGQKASLVYDDAGVFFYSSRPDLDLQKLSEVVEVGGEVVVYWDVHTSAGKLALFQKADGSVMDLPTYIREYFGDAFDVHYQDDMYAGRDMVLVLTRKDSPPVRALPVELLHNSGGTPGTRIFRILEPSLTIDQKLVNERKIWDNARVSHDLEDLFTQNFNGSFGSVFDLTDHRGRPLGRTPERSLSIIEGRLAHHAAFDPRTVQAKDPFEPHKVLSLLLFTDNLAAAQNYYRSHTWGTTTVDWLARALFDLANGLTDSEALAHIRNQTSLHKAIRSQWESEAYAAGSCEPYTFNSILGDMVYSPNAGGDAFWLAYYKAGDPQLEREWNGGLQRRNIACTMTSVDTLKSGYGAIMGLKMAWLNLPAAKAWLQALPH